MSNDKDLISFFVNESGGYKFKYDSSDFSKIPSRGELYYDAKSNKLYTVTQIINTPIKVNILLDELDAASLFNSVLSSMPNHL